MSTIIKALKKVDEQAPPSKNDYPPRFHPATALKARRSRGSRRFGLLAAAMLVLLAAASMMGSWYALSRFWLRPQLPEAAKSIIALMEQDKPEAPLAEIKGSTTLPANTARVKPPAAKPAVSPNKANKEPASIKTTPAEKNTSLDAANAREQRREKTAKTSATRIPGKKSRPSPAAQQAGVVNSQAAESKAVEQRAVERKAAQPRVVAPSASKPRVAVELKTAPSAEQGISLAASAALSSDGNAQPLPLPGKPSPIEKAPSADPESEPSQSPKSAEELTELPIFPDDRTRLQAIAWSRKPGKRLAVIDGSIVGEGASLGDIDIVRINRDDVDLRHQGRMYRLPFKP